MDYLDKSILKKKKKNNYTSIANSFLQDNSLSFEARGLGASLLSRPDDWDINISSLMAEGKIGRDKVKKIITELIQAGYMYKSQARKSGKFAKNILFISDEKDFLLEEVIEKEKDYPVEKKYGEDLTLFDKSKKKYGVAPVTGQPSTVKPLTENPEQQIKEYNKKKNITNTTTTEELNLAEVQTEKNSSSSSYEFLNNYKNINTGTKLNIKRYIKNLTESKFAIIYNQVLDSFNAGEIESFEAVLYKALKGEWTFKTPVENNVDTAEKDRKYVKAQANYWLSYIEFGYTKEQVLTNFSNAVHTCNSDLVDEYKTKIMNYLKRRGA